MVTCEILSAVSRVLSVRPNPFGFLNKTALLVSLWQELAVQRLRADELPPLQVSRKPWEPSKYSNQLSARDRFATAYSWANIFSTSHRVTHAQSMLSYHFYFELV